MPSIRHRVFVLLDQGSTGWRGWLVDVFLISLIALNVLAVIMETEAGVLARFGTQLYWFEVFSVVVFSIEYLLRYWSCVENREHGHRLNPATARWRYIFTPMAIVDLIAIAPFYLAFLFNIDLRFLRVLRLLRIFKLTRYSEAMTTLLIVLKDEINSFAAAIFIMLVVMILAASGIYLVEHAVQPDDFGSIPKSMWWAIVTLTTVGYGDATPLTVAGKFFAACIMIAGVGLVALPTGILASSFSENLARRREMMLQELRDALADGVIDEDEERHLNSMRKKLGLSIEKFDELKLSLGSPEPVDAAAAESFCPHCGSKLDKH